MEGYVLEQVYDYMNLAFGSGAETKEFWSQILIPHAAHAFNCDPEKLSKVKPKSNALVYAFAYHFGIELAEDFALDKSETPFTAQIVSLHETAKVYTLRSIPLVILSTKYKKYKAAGRTELALKSLKLGSIISKALCGCIDVVSVYETAELLLDAGLTDQAIQCAVKGLGVGHRYELYFTLMKAYYKKKDQKKVNEYCVAAMRRLKNYWGAYHPLHITIYSLMAFNLVKYKSEFEQARQLYKASLVCALRALGSSHVVTAKIYKNLGELELRMKNTEQGLSLIHICRCRRIERCRSRWCPYP
eukprot:TRINITY_DN7580_c0_g1_i3.p1 TRINITY_DN7580_c0_g1~~TRINITY_DN7580_c0_g1_i3.p1  ORF type:complete len:302 (+),score=55.27 TRINITY_DN7580_c0_g1_i3:51-956(+)